MAVTPSLQADGHLHDLLMAGTPARDTNFHEALRREHEAPAVEYWQPEQEPPPFKAPPPGYNPNGPPPKWGAPHQSTRRPPPIDVRAGLSLDQRLWLARLLIAPPDLVRLLDAPPWAPAPPMKAPPMKAPPFINTPPPPMSPRSSQFSRPTPPKHNGEYIYAGGITLASNRWTTYPLASASYDQWLEQHLQVPAMTSGSSSDSDTTYGGLPDLVDDPDRRRRSRSPSTISSASTCVPSATSAESLVSM